MTTIKALAVILIIYGIWSLMILLMQVWGV